MATDENYEIPGSGAVFTFGRSAFADNQQSHFFIRNDPVVEISCGDEHTAVVCENGRLFIFGYNCYGQLGFGHTRTLTKPSCLKYLKSYHSTHVGCGKGHTIVSTKCGKLFSFGSNSDGQLGVGDLNDRLTPCLVKTDHFGESKIVAVSAGCFHSACLTDKGAIYMWGSNSDGQCGVDVDTNLIIPTKIEFEYPITGVSCGYYHTAFISEGNLYSFGEEDNGKLGYRKAKTGFKPQKVELTFECAKVDCGGNHTLILSDKGRVFACGSNFSSQLGVTTGITETYTPIPLNLPEDIKITCISAGESHSAVITDTGELYTFGDGRYGKTCFEDNTSKSPVSIKLFNRFHCALVSCGGCHTMILARPRDTPDTDIINTRGQIFALPPLKVIKTLHDREMKVRSEVGNQSLKNDVFVTNSPTEIPKSLAQSFEDLKLENCNTSSPNENNDGFEDETFAGPEEFNLQEGENGNGLYKNNAEHSSKTEIIDKFCNNTTDEIIKSESKVKNFLSRLRKKKSGITHSRDLQENSANESVEYNEAFKAGSKRDQHRSITCSLL